MRRRQVVGLNAITITLASICTLAPLSSAEAAEQQNKEKDVEVVAVKGRAAQFYFFEESSMATKTPTDYMDIPQSIQVISNELIQDQAALQTTDLYRSISGFTQFSYSGVTARGFRQDQVRYDGVQGDPFSGFSIPQLFNIDRVEVLKGPTSMLYGGGQPGGLLNYVTKKPTFEQATRLLAFAGNYDFNGAGVETTGTIDPETLAYRVSAFYQNKTPFRHNTEETNTLYSGGLTWIASDATTITFQYDHTDQDLAGHRLRGVPVDDNGNFITDISYNPNEATDFQRLKADVYQAIIEHEFSDALTNRTVVRRLDNERQQNYHENRGLLEDGRTMVREFRDQERTNDEISVTTDFVLEFTTAELAHTLLFGGDYLTVDTFYSYNVGRGAPSNIPNIDILFPVYGADPSTYLLISRPTRETDFNRTGLYIQDQIRFNEQWLGVIGTRYDSFEDKQTGVDYVASDNNFSSRVGVIYQPDSATSIFANISEGFEPQSFGNQNSADQDDNGLALAPETSLQYEIGVKRKWLDDSLLSTLTVYNIVKNDVTTTNPLDTGEGDGIPTLIQIGEVTSKGVELDIVGDIAENWTGTLSYAYNDTTVTSEEGSGALSNTFGDRFVNAPRHTLGLWTRLDFPSINSAFAVGMDYVSDRISFNNQIVKPYTIWDASWRSTIDENIELQINVKNLFNREYATSGFNRRNGHFPGEPRTIQIQLSYVL